VWPKEKDEKVGGKIDLMKSKWKIGSRKSGEEATPVLVYGL
jgi:hypothetical protein